MRTHAAPTRPSGRAGASPRPWAASPALLDLQRTAGNAAVTALVQRDEAADAQAALRSALVIGGDLMSGIYGRPLSQLTEILGFGERAPAALQAKAPLQAPLPEHETEHETCQEPEPAPERAALAAGEPVFEGPQDSLPLFAGVGRKRENLRADVLTVRSRLIELGL
jgi:hypothetical protein